MNAILRERNAQRKNAIGSIITSGEASPEVMKLIKTVRRNKSVLAIGFSDEDLEYSKTFVLEHLIKSPYAEQNALSAADVVRKKMTAINTKIKGLPVGHSKEDRVKLVTERNLVQRDLDSINNRLQYLERCWIAVEILDAEMERRHPVQEIHDLESDHDMMDKVLEMVKGFNPELHLAKRVKRVKKPAQIKQTANPKHKFQTIAHGLEGLSALL